MKTLRGSILLILIGFSFTSFAGTFSAVSLVMEPWSADCQNPQPSMPLVCAIPQAKGPPMRFEAIRLGAAEGPGRVGVVSQAFNSAGLQGLATIYSVIPNSGDPHPPYLQLRIELISPARALCMNSVAWHPGEEMVPLICVGILGTQQVGVTVTGRMLPTSNFYP